MPVKVRIIDIVTKELIQEFSSISEAADFVKGLAKEKLHRSYTKAYISGLISSAFDICESALLKLGIRAVRSLKCCSCRREIFTPRTICEECEYYRDCFTDSDSDNYEKLMCESCGEYSDNVIFKGDKCQLCVVNFAEDPFGMF